MPKWLSVLLHALVIAGGAYATIASPNNAALITAAAGSINSSRRRLGPRARP